MAKMGSVWTGQMPQQPMVNGAGQGVMLPGETWDDYVRRMYSEQRQSYEQGLGLASQHAQNAAGSIAQEARMRADNAMGLSRNAMTLADVRFYDAQSAAQTAERGRQPTGSISQSYRRALSGY